jgi:phosphatidylcholine synthase
MVPCFFILVADVLPAGWKILCVFAITLSSAYQFTQRDAKTTDHFFKGFPSYWNIAVFYVFFYQLNVWVNLVILLLLAILSFVPIKYVYPSRLEYLTHDPKLRAAMLLATIVWGFATAGLLWVYPATNLLFDILSMGYLVLYFGITIYRTWKPLTISQ